MAYAECHSSCYTNVSVKNTFLHINDDDDEPPKIKKTRARSCPAVLLSNRFQVEDPWCSSGDDSGSYPTADNLLPVKAEESDDEDWSAEKCGGASYNEYDAQRQDEKSDGASYNDYDGPITTLMIRNIPCRCLPEKVLEDIDSMGFAGTYNFFYMPQTRRGNSNLGYAFINFKTAEAAATVQRHMVGHKFVMNPRRFKSQKICCISPAAIQGLENTKTHFMRTAVQKNGRTPFFFVDDELNTEVNKDDQQGDGNVIGISHLNDHAIQTTSGFPLRMSI